MLTFIKFFCTFLIGVWFGYIMLALLTANSKHETKDKSIDEENKGKK